jgi:hypothetical protein
MQERKFWSMPLLLVLTRSTIEEDVLKNCKTTGTGPSNGVGGCYQLGVRSARISGNHDLEKNF